MIIKCTALLTISETTAFSMHTVTYNRIYGGSPCAGQSTDHTTFVKLFVVYKTSKIIIPRNCLQHYSRLNVDMKNHRETFNNHIAPCAGVFAVFAFMQIDSCNITICTK